MSLIGHLEQVLANRDLPGGWMHRWLEAKKNEHSEHTTSQTHASSSFGAMSSFGATAPAQKIETPRYGFGDPTTNDIFEAAVKALFSTGAVRHGAECFNFHFPQELDTEFLVCWAGFQKPPIFNKVPAGL